jgi:hypothetical protein
MPRADGPCKVIEKINDNACKLELPIDFGTVSPTFNIVDLKPYFGEEDEVASRMTSIQEGEHDMSAAPTMEHIQGPILELVPSNLTIGFFRFLELFLTYMRI